MPDLNTNVNILVSEFKELRAVVNHVDLNLNNAVTVIQKYALGNFDRIHSMLANSLRASRLKLSKVITDVGGVVPSAGTVSADPTARVVAGFVGEGLTMNPLDQLTQEVTDLGTVIDSAVTLIGGLADQIRNNVGNPAALTNLANQLDGKKNQLAQAVAANTPAEGGGGIGGGTGGGGTGGGGTGGGPDTGGNPNPGSATRR